MKEVRNTNNAGYIFAAGLGALGGGILVAVLTRALPRMMSKMMSQMMTSMMSQMGDGECSPAEM